MSARSEIQPIPAAVPANAVLRAADPLGLKQGDLVRTLDVHRTAISRRKQSASLDRRRRPGNSPARSSASPVRCRR